MQTEKRAAVRTKEIESKTDVVASVEFVVRTALHDSVEDDFVHSIAGRIIAERENRGEEDAGKISSLTRSVRRGTRPRHQLQKGSEMASLVTSQNTGNIFSTRKLAIRRKKYKMSSKW